MKRFRNSGPSYEINSPVKYLFGLYQCLHHLSILTGGTGSGKRPIFSQKVEELTRFFVPAMSAWNPLFRKKCHEINESWRQQQIQNLKEHYEFCIEALKGSISASHLTPSDRLRFSNQARNWAKQTYRKKFRSAIFDKIDQMVQNLSEPKKTPAPTKDSHPQGVSSDKKRQTEKGQTAGTSTGSSSGGRGLAGLGAASNQMKNGGSPSPGAAPTRTSPSEKATAPGISTRVKVATAGLPSTPSKRKRSNSSMESPPSRTSPTQSSSQKRSKSSMRSPDKSKNSSPIKTPLNTPSITKFPKLKPSQRGQGMHDVWHIPKVEKDILILGDSNLARATKVQRSDAQVVSYSGINLLKMFRLLENFKFGQSSANPGRKPKHVILSVGLNDRGLKPSTNEVSLNKLINRTRQEFPDSKISIYQQPFDHRLGNDEICSLRALNDAVRTKCVSQGHNCIPALPKSKFKVNNSDKIHWTEECANSTLEHIFNHLN